jgi:dihydroorotate dehydrogenase
MTARGYRFESARLSVDLLGLKFSNPIGLAGGFDKDGECINALSALGFGHIEIGTVTAIEQTGNPKPRLFRLPSDEALINRMGFNNRGSEYVRANLVKRHFTVPVGINIGKSKIVPIENAIEDYLSSLERLYALASFIIINVSSPNTPGLRKLQDRDSLNILLRAIREKAKSIASAEGGISVTKPIFVKIAPDLNGDQLDDIITIVTENQLGGIIATNTTIARDGLVTPSDKVTACGDGGLSGRPLRDHSTAMIAHIYRRTKGKMPIIGVGGILSAEDAFEKICAGASLVQIYTGLVFHGPGFVKSLKKGLDELLRKGAFSSLQDAVGTRADEWRDID